MSTSCDRFAIQDCRRHWWTGEDWSREKSQRQLFATEQEASEGYADMQNIVTADVPLRTFVVPLWVAIRTNGVFKLDDLQAFLNLAFDFSLDVAHVGTGPTLARCRTEVEIDWNELNELPIRNSDNRQQWLWGPW